MEDYPSDPDMAGVNQNDLIRTATNGSLRSLGGLSAESIEIAEPNRTDLIWNTTLNNGTDSGGLSARSVNITWLMVYFLPIVISLAMVGDFDLEFGEVSRKLPYYKDDLCWHG